MSDSNPYAAPQSVITPELPDGELPYAPRLHRFGAALLDVVILLPVHFIIIKIFTPTLREASNPGLVTQLIMMLVGFAAYIGINWVFLKNGQTIGKKVAKVQVQKRSGGLFSAQDLILRRVLPIQLVASIPSLISPSFGLVGSILVLVDVLCIFRADFNTLHDDIANSKVVKLPA